MIRKNVPLADQVILEILSGIEKGDIVREGDLLWSEAELCQRFGVSRATVREALAKLEFAGVVIRRHGIGTYVNQLADGHRSSVQYWIDEAVGFMDLLRASNRPASRRVLAACTRDVGPLMTALGVEEDAPIFLFECVYLAASVPLIHCMTAIPVRLVEARLEDSVAELYCKSDSPYQFLENHCRRKVSRQRSEVSAVLADERLARFLEWDVGQPLLRVEEIGYDADLVPLFYGLNHFRGDEVSFLQVRRPALNIGGQTSTALIPACEVD